MKESDGAQGSVADRPLDNLPLELTSFIGREREVAEIERHLGDRRLLTLCGPGGSGKTRLALAVAQELVEVFEDGVWWVDLAPISDPKLLVRAVATVVGVPESQDASPAGDLVDHLRPRATLLVLDNCEHLVEECADLVATLLRACPDLVILATSREPLRVTGESSWQVPSLSLPEPGHLTAAAELAEDYEAVHLFVERARAVDAAFELTEENAPVVARLCQELDGIPLAIELAAARSRVLTVEQIFEKLEDPLRLLTSRDRSAAPRQRTLRATLQWSYDLLGEDERALFRRLSVFVGGWDLEAAETVGAGVPVDTDLVLDLLSALVDKSLALAETPTGSGVRYRMLEPVRQFGREKLQESGEEADLRRRHAGHYLDLAETAGLQLLGPDQGLWLGRLRTEFPNLREAQAWSLEPGEEEERARVRLRLPAALWRFWTGRRFQDGRLWLQTALDNDPGGFPAVRARALDGLGYILLFQQEYDRAIAALEEAVALYRELGDRSGEAFALANFGYALLHGGYMERVPAFVVGANTLMAQDLDDHARAYLRQILATAAILEGDLDSALAQFEAALALCRELGDLRNTSMALFNLGMITLSKGDASAGAALFEEGTRISRELADKVGGLYYVWAYGKLSAMLGRPRRAARLWGAAEALRERMGMSLSYLDLTASGYELDLAAVRSDLDAASFAAAWAEGRAMSPDAAIAYALEETARFRDEVPEDRTPPDPPMGKRPVEAGTEGTRNNLPAVQGGFVGREREMAEVMRALSAAQLLTLTGPGGCGKTRLAVEVARGLVDSFGDGVWMVQLASLTEGKQVPGAVASTLSVREQPGLSFTEILVDYLRSRRILLVLDNCEHLIEDCANLVDTLLGSCEHLRVLATSREPLGVPGEVNWMLPSLTVPDENLRPDPRELERFESVRLFVERAMYRLSGFELTEQNAPAVAEICRKLDGLPLAIELATSRVGTLSVGQISERLENSLGFLTAGDRTRSPRHRTLRAALDWSYELLDHPAQLLLGRLSVFVGGWTLEAAEAVGAGGPNERENVLDLLSGLVDRSLVVAEASLEGASRYRMLEPVRQYAQERLKEAETVRSRHASFFLALAERADPGLKGPEQISWLRRLDTEQGNLRAAMAWLLAAEDTQTCARLGWALWLFWWIRGRFAEGRRWMEDVLSRTDAASARAKVLFVSGTMACGQADWQSAADMLGESIELFRRLGDKTGAGYALSSAGFAAIGQGRQEQGIALLEEAVDLSLEVGEKWGAAFMLCFLAVVRRNEGDRRRAGELAEKGLALSREVEDREGTSVALYILAGLAHASGQHERARTYFEEALHLSSEVGDQTNVAYSLEGMASLAASEGRIAWAVRLWGAAEALLESIEAAAYVYAPDRAVHEDELETARARLGGEAFDSGWAQGRAMTPAEAVEYALHGRDRRGDEASADTISPSFPPIQSPAGNATERPRNNLPALRSVLVGRQREMSEIGSALSTSRLLTLTGAGGCGKTRLALEVARGIASSGSDDYPDGVWLVELASLTEGALVPGAVAAALGVRDRPDLSATDSLVEFLRSRHILILMDNCEHVIEECATLVDTLLGACEHLRVMATSRRALGVPGEISWTVPPLTVPEAYDLADPDALMRCDSVRLFVERARARLPVFVLSPQNAPAVANICRKLDGMPLAIELATARMGTLSVGQISERLGDALDFLTAADRTQAPRQRTLRAALEWSYGLLKEEERKLFGRLSVFAGGWDLEAAESLGAGGGVGAGDVLELLGALVDQSLVVVETTEGVSRYRMLEPVRQYAMELLESSPEAPEVRDRHAELFTSLAEQAHTELRGPAQVAWMRRVEQEHDNFRAAMGWAMSSGDYETAALLGWALWPFWFYRGYHREGRRLMESVLGAGTGLSLELRLRATVAVAVMAYGQGDDEAVGEHMSDLLELSRRAGGNAYAEGYARAGLGLVALNRGDLVRAAARLEEALPLFIECGELWTAAQTHTWLGTVSLLQGDQGRAVARFEEGLALARWIGDRGAVYNALYSLAQVSLARGEHEAARSNFVEGMGLSEEMGDLANVAYCLEGLATVAGAEGETGRSARLFGAAKGLHETIGVPVWTYYQPDRTLYENTIAELREALGGGAYEAAFSEGRAMSPQRAIAYALDETVPPRDGRATTQGYAEATPDVEEEHQAGLRIFALGRARVEKEGLPVDSPDFIQKSRELLYYLLSYPEGRTKEQIGLALWPEASTSQLRSSFHDTLFRLRRALGAKEWVIFEKRRYAFGGKLGYAYDVKSFEENVAAARRLREEAPGRAIAHLQEAIKRYRGDFLEDMAPSEWMLERQDELRRTYGESLLLLGELLGSQERHAEAADAYRQAISHDRFLEEAHRGLMRSQASLGEPGGALRHYDELARMLQEQLGSSPSAETIALYKSLRSGE